MARVKFIRDKEPSILALKSSSKVIDGALYVATDTGTMWMGTSATTLLQIKDNIDTNTEYTMDKSGSTIRLKKADGTVVASVTDVGEVNQNAFATVAVKQGNTTTNVVADSKSDTVTIAAGDNVTLTADANSDAITIAAKDTKDAASISTDASHRFVTDAQINTWNGKQAAMTIDTALSTTSANPVQNKVITAEVNKKANSSDLTSHTGNTTVHITSAERTAWNAKASTAAATTSAAGLMSAADKTKLDGIAQNANNYTHPSTHPATMITQDATHRFVNDTEKSTWNGKANANHTHTSIVAASNGVGNTSDLNTFVASGVYQVDISDLTNVKNFPNSAYTYGDLHVQEYNGGHVTQIYYSHSGDIFERQAWAQNTDGTWNFAAWHKVYTDKNKPTWSDVQSKPTTFTPASHTHSYASSDSAGGSANLVKNWGAVAAGVSTGRHIWISDSGTETKRVSDDKFTYNSATNTVSANISGKAATAGVADSANAVAWGNISGKPSTYAPSTHNHSATEITSGTLADARIPSLNASKITAGTFDAARIPGLDASKITGGIIDKARLPSYVDDVIEGYYNSNKFYTTKSNNTYSGEITGETGKIYVDLGSSPSKIYRFVSTQTGYVQINTDTNTTYSIGKDGNSIKLTGSDGNPSSVALSAQAFSGYTHPSYTARSGGPTAGVTGVHGGSFLVPYITSDGAGHVTGVTNRTVTFPVAQTSVSGNAGTATKLQTARNIAISGAVTGNANFDGSGNITISTSTNHSHSEIVTQGDTRSVATKPSDYPSKIKFAGLKNNTTIGAPSGDTYSYVVGMRGWSDNSGGNAYEFAVNNSNISFRTEKDASTWNSWNKVYTTANKPTPADIGAVASFTASASVSNTVGTPSVTVTKGGTSTNPTYAFAFNNIKGSTGATGPVGPTGPKGAVSSVTVTGTGNAITAVSGTSALTFTKGASFAASGHTHDDKYVKLAGSTMTGTLTGKSSSGSWISSRDNAAFKKPAPSSGGWGPALSQATTNGEWSIGNLGGEETLSFAYTTNANYNAGTNANLRIQLPAKNGTVALTSDIPTVPTPGNGTITVKQTGHTTVTKSFTVNQTGATEIALQDTWRGCQNNLTSTATDQSLSAYQGKLLNDKIKNTIVVSSTQPTSADCKLWIKI